MTSAQHDKYWAMWNRIRRDLIEGGLSPKLADAKRHTLHVKALGRDKSSKLLNNDDLDKVFGVFNAILRPADLNAQLHVEESEDERRAEAMEGCLAACWEMYLLGDNRMAMGGNRKRYVAGTARNVIKKEPADCTAAELNVVLGCLRASVARARAKNPSVAASMDADAAARVAGEPF